MKIILIFLVFYSGFLCAEESFKIREGSSLFRELEIRGNGESWRCVALYNDILNVNRIPSGKEIFIPKNDLCVTKQVNYPNVYSFRRNETRANEINSKSIKTFNKSFNLLKDLSLKENLTELMSSNDQILYWELDCDIKVLKDKKYIGEFSEILKQISYELTEDAWLINFEYLIDSGLLVTSKGGC
ncbi:hypothetical protein J8L86_07605 [Shewanella sp. MMG014]|uniref:hypothetical protein n=1 Tax=Shewanella sp. MMG014 TaxID=2822691 RepID=UPI001B3604C2|nr:hypothetical protein [Shewanella sp. MMG014]MBQ4889708.1 hypothetical protein [Shewanella sp. MMG014]